MTYNEALTVKFLRKIGCTWRKIAEWGQSIGLTEGCTQQEGRQLCEQAMNVLDEDIEVFEGSNKEVK